MSIKSINLWHADLWQLNISNIPTCKPDELYLFESFVKGIVMPEYGGENENTDAFIGFRAEHPIGHDLNRNLGVLQIEFKMDENFKIYTKLFNWMFNIRYGKNITTERLRDYVCSEINIIILDNMKRTQGRFCYTKATCIGLSALPFNFGTGEELSFQSNFEYEEVLWIPEDIPQCDN